MMLEGRVEVCGSECRCTGMRRWYVEDGRRILATGMRHEAGAGAGTVPSGCVRWGLFGCGDRFMGVEQAVDGA